MMYITVSETFIRIDSLQHFEIPRETYPTKKNPGYNIHCFDVMLICTNRWPSYIPQWLVHFSLNVIAYLKCKTLTIYTQYSLFEEVKNS